jgi:hypothetical protein
VKKAPESRATIPLPIEYVFPTDRPVWIVAERNGSRFAWLGFSLPPPWPDLAIRIVSIDGVPVEPLRPRPRANRKVKARAKARGP